MVLPHLWTVRKLEELISGSGLCLSQDLLEGVVANGDYVGISKEELPLLAQRDSEPEPEPLQDSPQINFTHPWYWFSVDGDCPNLPGSPLPPVCNAVMSVGPSTHVPEHAWGFLGIYRMLCNRGGVS